jgi:hypothetical protein
MNENPMAMCARLGDSELVAWEEYENSGYGRVVLTKDGEEIYSIDIGHGSPIPALQRLWAWEGHWALETVHVTIQEQGNVIYSQGRGQVTIDGVLLNESLGCEEVFGFQLIHDQPFYFVSRGGLQDARYAGLEVPLAYDEIPHYNCCGNATLNPQMFKDMVAFFARRGETWYYTEIGLFALP